MQNLDSDARGVLDRLAASGYPTLDQLEPAQSRSMFNLGFKTLQGPKPAMAEVRDLSADLATGPMTMRLYRPSAAALLPALVYFHGGGFVIGDLEVYDSLCRHLAAASGCAVIAPDYRLAPEHRFPAGVEDAIAATQWIAQHASTLGIDAQRLAVGGDSAGGNLAAVVALAARDAGGPAIAHQLLLYPVTAWMTDSDSYRRCGKDYFLTESLMQYFGGHYINSEADIADWRCSPLRAAQHAGLPSATVLVCGYDPLRDEGVAYAAALRQAGVDTRLIEYGGQIHGFLLMEGVIAEALPAFEELGQALRACSKSPGRCAGPGAGTVQGTTDVMYWNT